MFNHYIAMMSEPMAEPRGWGVPREEKPVVTLPAGCFKAGEFHGLTGALSIWNGPPPPWCVEVIEVKCQSGWIHVTAKDYKILWSKS